MSAKQRFDQPITQSFIPNIWDFFAIILFFGILTIFIKAAQAMSTPYSLGIATHISLDPKYLPLYSIRSILRMLIALIFSLLFTFIFGTLAAKYKRAERIILPAIDILQSVPILGFLTLLTPFFISLFPNRLLGPECASIFAIFTSQAWNMAISFYQSLKTIPHELIEASQVFQLNAWKRFWRVEAPFAAPSLIWNMMMSMSGGWFFVVASESISIANQDINLPGIGSYIALAISNKDMTAIWYAIISMFIIITLYDQFMFRPLIAWSEKFKNNDNSDSDETEGNESWVLNIFQSTRLVNTLINYISIIFNKIFRNKFFIKNKKNNSHKKLTNKTFDKYLNKLLKFLPTLLDYLILIFILYSCYLFISFARQHFSVMQIAHVFYLGFITGFRIFILLIICSLVWVPIGVWIGMNPRATKVCQPIIQFLAAFPPNLIYPLAVSLIIAFNLNFQIWTAPLLIIGTQWYILFNVIAGASVIPKELRYAVRNFGVSKTLWWKRFVLPAIFPYYVTGLITAAGGAWNASIITEVVKWGNTTLTASGIGSYITKAENVGNFADEALGIAVMSIIVVLINKLLWQRLYNMAESRFSIN